MKRCARKSRSHLVPVRGGHSQVGLVVVSYFLYVQVIFALDKRLGSSVRSTHSHHAGDVLKVVRSVYLHLPHVRHALRHDPVTSYNQLLLRRIFVIDTHHDLNFDDLFRVQNACSSLHQSLLFSLQKP